MPRPGRPHSRGLDVPVGLRWPACSCLPKSRFTCSVDVLAFERARSSSVEGVSEEHEARTWIITGASSGLGLALARAALEAGERVVGTARRAERFGRLPGAYEGQLLAVEHDVRDTDGAGAV